MLQQGAGPLANLVALPPCVEAEHARRSSRGFHQTEERANRRRLSGAVRAKEAEHDAGRDFERQVIQRPDRAEVANQSLGLNSESAHAGFSLCSTARTGAASRPTSFIGNAVR